MSLKSGQLADVFEDLAVLVPDVFTGTHFIPCPGIREVLLK